MPSRFARDAIILGLLSAIGPFAIDMYLPALPTIAADLHVSTAATQMTLMVFFVTFGLSQLGYGPAADIWGRKNPLYFGLSVFILGSIGCQFSSGISALIVFRAVQGLGAAAVMVIPRAIIRDLHTGVDATRLMSLVMLVISVSPCLAPLTGSGLIAVFGWRAIFAAVALTAVLALMLCFFALEETMPANRRLASSWAAIFRAYGTLLMHRRFLSLTFMGGFAMASFFVFLASSSFIYIDHYGLSTTQFSLAFAVNAMAFIGASQFSAPLAKRFGVAPVISGAVNFYAVMALLLFVTTLLGFDRLPVLMSLLFLTFTGLGLVIPASMVLALDDHGPIAGMAAALGGTLQMVTGAVVIAVMSPFFDGSVLPMVTAIFIASICAFILARLTFGQQKPV
eukprot:gene2426-2461_t